MSSETKRTGVDIDGMVTALEERRVFLNQTIDTTISNLKTVFSVDAINLAPQTHHGAKRHSSEVSAGDFFNHTVVDAAIKYLDMVGEKQSTEQLLAVFKKGGMVVTDGSAKTLLNRHARLKKDLVRIGRGLWGLKKWYDKKP